MDARREASPLRVASRVPSSLRPLVPTSGGDAGRYNARRIPLPLLDPPEADGTDPVVGFRIPPWPTPFALNVAVRHRRGVLSIADFIRIVANRINVPKDAVAYDARRVVIVQPAAVTLLRSTIT